MRELDVSGEIPEDIVWPLKSYLGELPGYDPTLPLDKQKGDEPSKQHGYAQFYFTPIFAKLATSLGHIFGVECGDIDMRDIVLNRRILVVICRHSKIPRRRSRPSASWWSPPCAG